MSRITHIVVHYTATYADQDITRADVAKMHKARGWRDIGYHWFIRRDGTVEAGRPETEVGAHVGGQNTGKIGISWAGGIERSLGPNTGVDNRTPAQTAALIKLIRECLTRYPGAKVVGHRDLAATQCPGFDVQTWWAGVNKTRPLPPTSVSPDAPAKTPGVKEDEFHIVQTGETWFSIAREHGIPMDVLLAENNAKEGDILQIGRRLRVLPAGSTNEPSPASQPQGFWAWLIAAIFGK